MSDSFADKAENALHLIKDALRQANTPQRKEQVIDLVQRLMIELWPLTMIEDDESRRSNERDFKQLSADIWELSPCDHSTKKALEKAHKSAIGVFATDGRVILYGEGDTTADTALEIVSVSETIEIGELTDEQLVSATEAMRWINNGLIDPDGTEH